MDQIAFNALVETLLSIKALAESDGRDGLVRGVPGADTIIQWSVFVFISIPIGVGLTIFGWYAVKGEYNHLPENSEEL